MSVGSTSGMEERLLQYSVVASSMADEIDVRFAPEMVIFSPDESTVDLWTDRSS